MKSRKSQQMVVLPCLRLCPALLPGSPVHSHQAWFKAKNNSKCSEVSSRAPLLKQRTLHMRVLQDPEQGQGESSRERCLRDLLQERGWGRGWCWLTASCLHPSAFVSAWPLHSPREAQLEEHVHPTAQAGTETPRCFYGVLLLRWSPH